MALKEKLTSAAIPTALGIGILVVMGLIISSDTKKLTARHEDLPPRIEFTWSPAGPVDLKEMRGFLSLKDDYALDFKTYRMRLVEVDKTIDLPIDGLIGKDYEQPVSFGIIAGNPRLNGRLTVEISIADDRGQKSTLTRVITLK